MSKTGIITIIVVVLALAGGAFVLSQKNSDKTGSSTTNPTSSTTTTPTDTNTTSEASSENTITYTNDGFSPATLTVKSGTKVTIKNDSSHPLQFDSDPHPVHTDDPELNVGVVSPGKSMTFTATNTGSHGYHNHLNSSDTGTIVVQ